MDESVPDSAGHEHQGGMRTRARAFIRALRLSCALCIFRTHIEFKWELPSTSSWQHFGIMMLDSTKMKGLNTTRVVPERTPPLPTSSMHRQAYMYVNTLMPGFFLSGDATMLITLSLSFFFLLQALLQPSSHQQTSN